MLELVRRRHAGEQQIGLIGVDDVLDHRHVRRRPVQALLDVGLLAHDARFEHGEVGSGRRRELLRQELGEVTGEPRLARPRRPRRDGAAHRGVEQAHARQVGRQHLDLHEETCGEPRSSVPPMDLDLHIGGLALAKVGNGVGGILGRGEQHAVVAGDPVVGAVEDVRVQAVLVDAEVEHPHPHLHRRAERLRQRAGPPRRRHRRRAGERRPDRRNPRGDRTAARTPR